MTRTTGDESLLENLLAEERGLVLNPGSTPQSVHWSI